MITLFGFIILGIVIGAIIGYNETKDFIDRGAGGIVGGAVGWIIGAAIALMISTPSVSFQEVRQLESLQDGSSGSHGSFFLGIGSIDNKMQYVYYYRDGEYYQMGQLDYTQAKIKYVNAAPVLRITWHKHINTNWGLGSGVKMGTQYVFEVPKGTIVQNYTLDAK